MAHSYSTKLRVPNIPLTLFSIMLTLAVTISLALGQTKDSRGKNNPYSPSPVGKVKEREPTVTPVKSGNTEIAFITQNQNKPDTEDRPTVAQNTYKIVKNANLRSLPPTEIYKVGVGDVLFVNLKNTVGSSGYYTVRTNGTIDFPLAGENVIVADQTVEDIEEMLASDITLFPDPQVEV